MSWRRNFKREVEEKQREADEAVAQATINYMDAVNLQFISERIARGLLKMQIENHLGPKLFGVKN
jgi:hypothetical protein